MTSKDGVVARNLIRVAQDPVGDIFGPVFVYEDVTIVAGDSELLVSGQDGLTFVRI